ADFQQARPDRVRQDAGRDGDAEAPAGLETNVEVGKRQHASQARANQHRAPGKLRHAVAAAAINLLVPMSLDRFGRAYEAGDRHRPASHISSSSGEGHRWRFGRAGTMATFIVETWNERKRSWRR